MDRMEKTVNLPLPIGCHVERILDNGGCVERVYKCPNGKKYYIPESLLFSEDAA